MMRRTRMPGTPWAALLAGAVALAAPADAWADVIVAMSREASYTFTTGGPVPLDMAGARSSPVFTLAGPTRLVVSYTARCAVDGPEFLRRLDVDIHVVDVATGAIKFLPPGDSVDVFCMSNATSGLDEAQMNTVNAVAQALPRGTYRVQVFARPSRGGRATLGYSSLVVWR